MRRGWRCRHTPKWLKMWSSSEGRKTDEMAKRRGEERRGEERRGEERRGEGYDQFGRQYVHTGSLMMCPLLSIYRTPSKDMCADVQGLLSAEANKAMECRTTECCWE